MVQPLSLQNSSFCIILYEQITLSIPSRLHQQNVNLVSGHCKLFFFFFSREEHNMLVLSALFAQWPVYKSEQLQQSLEMWLVKWYIYCSPLRLDH